MAIFSFVRHGKGANQGFPQLSAHLDHLPHSPARLVAAWPSGADGRPICRWSAISSSSFH